MRLLVAAALVVLAWAGTSLAHDDIEKVKLVSCYDGDTCTFEIPGAPSIFRKMEVRFRGIDTPEMHGKCEAEKAKALAAKTVVLSHLRNAKDIRLTKVNRDKYFRLNAHVVADGVNLSDMLVETHYAVVYWGRGEKQNWCQQ
mgnify:CR=1 FL=1